MTDSDSEIMVDLLVVGGGMAGMTAGALAASRGYSVGLVEKAPDIGGSAVLSGGGLIKLDHPGALTAANPGGDPRFARILHDSYDEVLGWIASLGVSITEPADVEEIVGISCKVRGIDILQYIALARLEIEHAGGWVVTDTRLVSLQEKEGKVVGAIVSDREAKSVVRARAVILATGGFQGSAELRERYLGPNARKMLLRANRYSEGDGLTLAQSVGASTSREMKRFYGHTLPCPLNAPFEPRDFVRLSMPYMVTRSLLLDRTGKRFVDESHGYYSNAQAVLSQPDARALLVGDQELRDADAAGSVINRTLGFELIDRPSEARSAGARVCEAATAEGLEADVGAWGYRGVAAAVAEYNRQIAQDLTMEPARKRNRRTFRGPFFAIEVQPAITFTFGGLRVNESMQVLRGDETPIAGLYAAGADIGGVFCEQYASGLSLAAISAFRAVDAFSRRSA